MSKELFFINQPAEFKPGIKVYPPTVKDVIVTDKFNAYCRLITYSQEEVEDEFLEANHPLEQYPTPMEFLLCNSYNNKEYEKVAKEAFRFFIHDEVTFLYELKIILIGDLEQHLKSAKSLEDLPMIREDDFFDFQNLVRMSMGAKQIEPPVEDEDPYVKEMKRRARWRDRLKAKQAEKSANGVSFFTSLVSICCMGVGISPLNIGEMSYIAFNSIMRKYQDKEKYELDIDSLLAGADSKKIKPQYWIRNFEE